MRRVCRLGGPLGHRRGRAASAPAIVAGVAAYDQREIDANALILP